MLVRVSVLAVAMSILQACGVIMGGPYVREEETIVAVRPGLSEPAGVTYAAGATGAFYPGDLTAVAYVTLARTQHCRGYSEVELSVRGVSGRTLSSPGLALDAGVLAAGIVGSLIVPEPAVKGAVILGAAVPLVVDGVTYLDRDALASETRIEKQYETGPAAVVPCDSSIELAVPLVYEGTAVSPEGGIYRLRITEAQLIANGTADGILLSPMVAATTMATNQTVHVKVLLDEGYSAYLAARLAAERYKNPLRVAKFLSAYPNSQAGGAMRTNVLRMLPAAQDDEELQAVLGLENLDPEFRKAIRARFTELRTGNLLERLPGKLALAASAERNANTFLLNGFREEGRQRLAEKEALVAEACRDYAELALRDPRSRAELLDFLRGKLGADAAVALAWLRTCP